MGQPWVATVLYVLLVTQLSACCAAAGLQTLTAKLPGRHFVARSEQRPVITNDLRNRQNEAGGQSPCSAADLQTLQSRGKPVAPSKHGSTPNRRSADSDDPDLDEDSGSNSSVFNDAQLLLDKPQGDHRQYQHARLSNGIEVLNINDRSTRTAAMAVAVEAGLWYDPPYYYGLAHLTEHSLFLGSERFPERSGLDEFLARHGGSSNAYTAEEVTVYYASLDAAAFDTCLERFADMFRAPLLNEDRIYKEVSAVISEHSKNVGNPAWYSERVMLSAGNPHAPMAHFHTGDNSTLKNLGPKNISDEIKEYFKKNYCPARMHVVTFGSDSLRTQLHHANRTFGSIPRLGITGKCSPEPHRFATPDPFPASKLRQWLLVEGSGSPVLWMLFPLEDLARWHRSHPLNYIEYIVGNTATGSLIYVLRDVLSLAYSVDVSGEDSSAGTLVWVTASLTGSGAEMPGCVMDVIFTYFRHASRIGASSRAIQSLADAAKLMWDWGSSMGASSAASTFAEAMTRLDADELMSGDSLTEEPNRSRVLTVLAALQPDNMNVGLITPDAEKVWQEDNYSHVRTLPHYGVKYNVSNLTDWAPDYHSWGSMDDTGDDAADVEKAYLDLAERLKAQGVTWDTNESLKMALPEVITDIPHPQDVTICNGWAERGEGDIIAHLWGVAPKLLINEPSVELWFRKGWTDPQPKVSASMTLRVKNTDNVTSAYDTVVLQVGMHLLADELNSRLYDVGYKGFSFTVSETHRGVYVEVAGFANNLLNMTDAMIREMNHALDLQFSTDDESMTRKQTKTTRVLNGMQMDLLDDSGEGISSAYEDQKILLTPRVHSKKELSQVFEDGPSISYEQAADAVIQAREGPFYVTTLILGNYNEEDAETLHNRLLDGFESSTGVEADEVERVTPVVRPEAPVELRRRTPRDGDKNHVTIISILIGPATVQNRVMLGMVGWIYSQLVFDSLRTRKELGYVVGGGVNEMSNIVTVDCYVQGEKMLPDAVEMECEHVWHKLLPQELEDMTPSQFEAHKESFKSSLLDGPLSANSEHAHFEDPILLGGCLHLRTSMLAFLETVSSKERLIKVWKEVVQPVDSSDPSLVINRRKVAIKYFGHGVDVHAPPDAEEILQMALHAGLNKSDAERVARERHSTLVVSEANSTVREQIVVNDGGYFSTELHCDWNEHDNHHSADSDFVDPVLMEGRPIAQGWDFLSEPSSALAETEVHVSGLSEQRPPQETTSGNSRGSTKALMRSEGRTVSPHRPADHLREHSRNARSPEPQHGPRGQAASPIDQAAPPHLSVAHTLLAGPAAWGTQDRAAVGWGPAHPGMEASNALLAPQPARVLSRQSMIARAEPRLGKWREPVRSRSSGRQGIG